MARPLIDDELWAVIEPLLPPPKPRRKDHPGRKPADPRRCLTGIVFVLKTGIQWEDLPVEMGVCGSCEKRPARSKVSVDGNNLAAGSYRAVVTSGGATTRSPFANTVEDEGEFDFDSRPGDIAEGAVPIAANFIQDGRVRAWMVNQAGQRVTPVVQAMCRVRR